MLFSEDHTLYHTTQGRKLPSELENPFDDIFIDVASWLNTYIFRPLNYTPNMITTMSLFLGLSSALLFHKQWYIMSLLFFVTAYILDCADGAFARKYNMETTFGDYYDHISDLLKSVAFFISFVYHPFSIEFKVVVIAILLILYVLSLVHLGCQEAIYNPDANKKHDSLSGLKVFCGSKEDSMRNIQYTRYFGCGTFVICASLVILAPKIVKLKT